MADKLPNYYYYYYSHLNNSLFLMYIHCKNPIICDVVWLLIGTASKSRLDLIELVCFMVFDLFQCIIYFLSLAVSLASLRLHFITAL